MKKCIVVVGTIFGDKKIYGVFKNYDIAAKWACTTLDTLHWEIVFINEVEV